MLVIFNYDFHILHNVDYLTLGEDLQYLQINANKMRCFLPLTFGLNALRFIFE